MSDKEGPAAKGFSIDWLVKGVLTKAGDALDGLTGRKWQPSSSLATSELAGRLKALVDSDVRDLGPGGRFAPHFIRLKVEWETFGSGSEELLAKLERELTVALVDHLNDKRYHTYAPVDLRVQTDYFTKGVKLYAAFDGHSDAFEEIDLMAAPPAAEEEGPAPAPASIAPEASETASATEVRTVLVTAGDVETVLTFEEGAHLSVGRGKECDLVLDDASVSKSHASLAFNGAGLLILADTGSTNGTFVSDEKIDYGTAVEIPPGTEVRFGDCSAVFEYGVAEAAE